MKKMITLLSLDSLKDTILSKIYKKIIFSSCLHTYINVIELYKVYLVDINIKELRLSACRFSDPSVWTKWI